MNERRSSERIPMKVPVEIWWKSRTGSKRKAKGKVGDISGSGLFIEGPIHLPRETSIMIKVQLPREGTRVPLELVCQGRVVRGNPSGKTLGVAALIDDYELRPLPRTTAGKVSVTD